MGWLAASLVTLTLVLSAASEDGGVCHLHNYVSSCVLNILEEHIEATAIINHCHVPLDITFLIVYQYRNSTRHSWKYTFVTSNQNERVLIPGLLLPIAPHAPVFLYARVPEREFNMHNSSFVAIEASFIAELSREKWEEADFLNHTVFISPSNDCHFSRGDQDPIPWIIGGLFAVALLSGLLGGGCYMYRKRKMAADQLALVSAMEVGMPGSQPYQMDTMTGQTTAREPSGQEQEAVDRSTPDGKAESSAEREEPQSRGTNNEVSSGKKGFKFERLKEDVSFQSNAADLEDPSVIIANPAYQEEIHKRKKKGGVKKQEQVDKLDLSSHDQTFTQGGGIINRMYQEGADTPQHKNEEENNQEVLDDVKTAEDSKLENDESLEESSQVGQGARRKVRGAVSSSTIVSAKAGDAGDSQKCL
ncbi:uncharacterized protein LOC126998850 [Eriocheir sinensis]|uniref:uncharacterized protein LOC126998850 n=1 Tax=Eriocheir sinensis TaxID=95602 RepID=UPI0021C616BB|nr:uncharacterized protein LOC126998850 [Eriocheir sinensis]